MFKVLNNQYQQFLDFATDSFKANNKTAIAKTGAEAVSSTGASLNARTIVAKTGDFVGNVGRRHDNEVVNNTARSAFKQSVADVFGDEKNIPDSVLKAMRLKDYDLGKPLTARRIQKVNDAIDALQLRNAFETGDTDDEMENLALAARYTRKDFARLNLAANYYAQEHVGKVSLKDALLMAMDRKSALNAAMECGPLYMNDIHEFNRAVSRFESLKNADADFHAGISHGLTSAEYSDPDAISGFCARYVSEIDSAFHSIKPLLDVYESVRKDTPHVTNMLNVLESLPDEIRKASEAHSCKEQFRESLRGDPANLYNFLDTVNKAKWMSKLAGAIQRAIAEIYGTKDSPGTPEAIECAKTLRKIATRLHDTLAEDKRVIDNYVATRGLRHLTPLGSVSFSEREEDEIKCYIKQSGSTAISTLKELIAELDKNGLDAIRFNDGQEKKIVEIVKKAVGKGRSHKAEAIASNIIAELQKVLFANAISRIESKAKGGINDKLAETIVSRLEKNSVAFGVIDLGFDMSKPQDVKKGLEQLLGKNLETGTFNEKGMLRISLREYDPGYVTFNGIQLPPADDSTPENYDSMANNDDRRGFAKFLENTFPDKKLRKAVSVACSMTCGIIGVINELRDLAEQPVECPMTGTKLMKAGDGGIVAAHIKRDPRDNLDISIDKEGNVTVKATHYNGVQMLTLTDEDKVIDDKADGKADDKAKGKPLVRTRKVDDANPIIQKATYTATVKIAKDGSSFAVTDFTQDMLHDKYIDEI